MGLFENLGRKVESFKQQAEEAAEETTSDEATSEEDALGECADCGEPVAVDRSECPSCGGDVVAAGSEDG